MLLFYCRLDLLVAAGVLLGVWLKTQKQWLALAVAAAVLGSGWLLRSLDVSILETFIARPWIWFIMA